MTNIEQICNYINSYYSEKEKSLLQENCLFGVDNFSTEYDISWPKIEELYKELLKFNGIYNYILKVAPSGSDLIKDIFKKYVNSNTFIISTTFNYQTVIDEINKLDKKYLYNYSNVKTFNFNELKEQLDNTTYDNIFIYFSGINFATGQIIPQEFFIKLKEFLDNYQKSYKIMLDDVHGMFIIPRDYSIFDFILYTGHSYIDNFDMGILWSKEDNSIGYYNFNRALCYYSKIKIFLNNLNKIYYFSLLMTEYFSEELADIEHFSLISNTSPHIFGLQIKDLNINQKYKNELQDVHIIVSNSSDFLSFRLTSYLYESPTVLINSLITCKKVLLNCKKLRILKNI